MQLIMGRLQRKFRGSRIDRAQQTEDAFRCQCLVRLRTRDGDMGRSKFTDLRQRSRVSALCACYERGADFQCPTRRDVGLRDPLKDAS
jgi:hypothetical protein